MKSASLAFALLSALALIGAAPVSQPQNDISQNAPHPEAWTNPTPHIYQSGERVTPAYGPFTDVADWKARRLVQPPEGHRWVHYGDSYLLIESDSALITTIVMGSLPEGRA